MTPIVSGELWSLITAIVVGPISIGCNYLVTARQTRQLKAHDPAIHTDQIAELTRDVSQIKNQVKNSHSTNLRDDIDKVIVGVGECKSAIHRIGDEQRIDRRTVEKLARGHYRLKARVEDSIAKHHSEDNDDE